MWMDRHKPELEDVLNAFKELFGQLGISAKRADGIEHQGVNSMAAPLQSPQNPGPLGIRGSIE